MSLRVRAATEADLPEITAIYAHHVRHGLASFEIEPPDLAEVTARFRAVRGHGFPWLACEAGGVLAGYAYATSYRTRPGYRFCLEDSVYVRPDMAGRGLGRALLARLLEECEAIGCRQLVAVIGDSGNAASIGLHSALGFQLAGTLRSVGFKHGRWVDSVLMQRPIGPGDTTLPEDPTPKAP